jgi:hypothetical protein
MVAWSIIDQSITDADRSNITRFLLLQPVTYQEFVSWTGEGDREERKKER